MGKLEGKVAVITGGNSGMGLSTAELYAKEGAKVVITGRRQKDTEEAAKSAGANVVPFVGDIAKPDDLDKLTEFVKSKYGKVDIIFANAGIGRGAPFGTVSEEQFDEVFDINVKGTFFTVQKLLPLLPDGGSVILNASIASVKGIEGTSVYSATKAALRSFARTWTADLKARRIRVNVLSPGTIDTPIFEKSGMPEEAAVAFKAHWTSLIPLGRIGQGEDIAKAALFLGSDDSSFITGIELFVDGGVTAL